MRGKVGEMRRRNDDREEKKRDGEESKRVGTRGEKWTASLCVTHEVIIHETFPTYHYTPQYTQCVDVCVLKRLFAVCMFMLQFCTLSVLFLVVRHREVCELISVCLH